MNSIGSKPHSTFAPAEVEALEPRTLLAAVKIMPLGNSITQSFDTDAGYRFWLSKQLTLDGYDVDFVGSQKAAYSFSTATNLAEPLYKDFDQDHEGHAGFRADQLLAGLPGWLSQNVPDVVLIHVGSNDMFQSQDLDETVGELSQIIDLFRAANPNVTILLGQLIPARVLVQNLQALNARMPALAESKNTAQSRVIVVDQFTGFDPIADLYDEYHPNLVGENKIAAKWFQALTQVLPAPAPAAQPVTWLSELQPASATNGQGPVELNFSNGAAAAKDGGAINLNGVSTIRGLGVHAQSEIMYDLAGKYTRFQSEVGIDDEVGSAGSVVFQVLVDDVVRFDSGVVTGSTATKPFDIDVAGAGSLKLVVTDAGDGNDSDHADWANARLLSATNPNPNPTPAPSVTSSKFRFNTAPHALKFSFSANVSASLESDDLILENLTTSTMVPASSMAVSYKAATNTAIFTFPGLKGGILPDGRYRATLKSARVTDAGGTALAADHVFEFFFLLGDANHDGAVNRADFSILLRNYRGRDRNFAHGDFNYDGKISRPDFNILARRYGKSVLSDSAALTGRRRARLIDGLRDELKRYEKGEKTDKNRGDDQDNDAEQKHRKKLKHSGGDRDD